MRPRNNAFGGSGLAKLFLFCLIPSAPLLFGAVHTSIYLTIACLSFLLLVPAPEILFRIGKLPRFFTAVSLFVFLWAFFQFFFVAAGRHAAGYELLKWLSAGVLLLVTQGLSKKTLTHLLLVLALTGLLESVYGLFEVISGREKVLWLEKGVHSGFVTGSYFNRNHLAGLLEMAIGVQLGFLLLAFHRESIKQIVLISAVLLMTFAGLIQTGSRAGMLSFGLSLLLFAGVLLFSPGRKRPWGFFFYLVLIGAALLYGGKETLVPRFLELTHQAETLDGRLTAWKDTLRLISAHWALGIGLGNYQWVFPQFQSADLFLNWGHAHQDYLELAAELGVPVFCLWLAGMAGLWLHCLRKFAALSTELFPLGWGCLLGITSLSLHGLNDFNFAVPANVMIFFILWGFILRFVRLSEKGARPYEHE